MSSFHTPVMVGEVLEGLHIQPDHTYIDATCGGGGHAVEIVRHGGRLLALDTDKDAIDETTRLLSSEECDGWKVVQGNFRDIAQIAEKNGFDKVDGILFDLGVSSHQLDTKDRGFSYRNPDALIDLRLDIGTSVTAADILNTYSEDKLYEIFSKLGEEKYSRAIARTVFHSRSVKAFQTTGDAEKAIQSVVGERERPATLSRVFQALRIEVNGELEALKAGLAGAERRLTSGGRLVVISFHSLEDRIVKLWMRKAEWNQVTKKPIIAGYDELSRNRRSRSAKLRVAEKR